MAVCSEVLNQNSMLRWNKFLLGDKQQLKTIVTRSRWLIFWCEHWTDQFCYQAHGPCHGAEVRRLVFELLLVPLPSLSYAYAMAYIATTLNLQKSLPFNHPFQYLYTILSGMSFFPVKERGSPSTPSSSVLNKKLVSHVTYYTTNNRSVH